MKPTALHIIYTASEMVLSKKPYESWKRIQAEYPGYKASLGPWSIEEIEEFMQFEYPKINPSASLQLQGFMRSSDSIHVVSFSRDA
ncbi:hypothetical protein [Herbaspirillum seropedicae]|uniref:hypothetical protein n=1 Tax=Herbaspirillum seropedicae TaxID=964 RepID=UPI000847D40C|nr:hypothetical protein [Herbaspirillum seropedicae]AON55799.1 hypothetical protein Hsc_3533 [Herbaspirillum seropedicae]